jgi:hypothetical protein
MVVLIKILLFWLSLFLCFAPATLLAFVYVRIVKKRRMTLWQKAIDEGRQTTGYMIAKKSRKEGIPDNKGRHLARYQYTGTDGSGYARWFSLSVPPPKELVLYLKRGQSGKAYTETQILNGKSGGILFLLLFIVALFASHEVNQMLCAQFLP